MSVKFIVYLLVYFFWFMYFMSSLPMRHRRH